MKYKLSICIATYNRANFLNETLYSIVSQLTNDVEVIIVDGNSNDNTSEIVNKHKSVNNNIKYYCLQRKGGVDYDFNITIENANGDYCWLFSDDDLLKPNAVNTILLNLEKQNYSAIIVNSELCDYKIKKIYKFKALNIYEDKIYDTTLDEQNKLFIEMGSYLSFIGCLIIKKELWLLRKKDIYIGTEFIHVGILFQDYLPNMTLFLHNPLISIRLGNAQWSSRAFNIWLINWPKLIWSFDNFSAGSKNLVVKKLPLSQYSKLVYFKVLGVYNYEKYQSLKNNFEHNYINLFIAFMIVKIDKKIFKSFIYLYAKLRKREWLINEIRNAK